MEMSASETVSGDEDEDAEEAAPENKLIRQFVRRVPRWYCMETFLE